MINPAFQKEVAQELTRVVCRYFEVPYKAIAGVAKLEKEEEITIIVQVNGKVRSRLEVPVDIDDAVLQKQALEDERVLKFTQGNDPKKIIVVQKKLVNIVI